MPTEPLSGLRVLDLGTFIAAPFCGTLLAEFGAEVVKVEDPNRGDSLRTLGEECRGVPLLWLQEARNKHAITCNLREPDGQAVIRDLVRSGYTIVLENFRPGTLERWNLGYDRLSALDPGIIMVRITGFGQNGPAKDRPGFGRIAQAFANVNSFGCRRRRASRTCSAADTGRNARRSRISSSKPRHSTSVCGYLGKPASRRGVNATSLKRTPGSARPLRSSRSRFASTHGAP